MTLDVLEVALKSLIGIELDRPRGSLAGHAAALPIEDLVHEKLEKILPGRALRHYEFLNHVLASVSSEDLDKRFAAFGPPSLQYLLCRGKEQMRKWDPSSLFDVKQNDTAETVIFDSVPFDPNADSLFLVDVKSHNISKNGQPPNIMSAGKLAEALALALDEGKIKFDFVYLGLGWEAIGEKIVILDATVVSLFKMTPDPYINWVAAEQLQFQIHEANQDFAGSKEEWAKKFLSHFSSSLELRLEKQNRRLERFRRISQSSA